MIKVETRISIYKLGTSGTEAETGRELLIGSSGDNGRTVVIQYENESAKFELECKAVDLRRAIENALPSTI